MISRRSFLKTAGIATLSLSAGFGLGKVTKSSSKTEFISIYGFLPDDKKLISRVFNTFGNQLNAGSINSVSVSGGSEIAEAIRSGLSDNMSSGLLKNNQLMVRVAKLNAATQSDILIRKDGKILNPEFNYDNVLLELRNGLKAKDASFFFSAEISNNSFLGNLFKPSNTLVIENDKGVVDEIKLDRKVSEINIAGDCGNTVVSFGENSAHVKSASCRNKQCMHGNLATSNSLIACAPNRLILRLT
ncbi:MAG: NusG domain II-containing protein [Ignavibacteriaceae bacterium]